jgi:redox-sensitive bicupin YhaK (pirin superfamily)
MIEIVEARRRSLGGFEVGRVLPHLRRRMVGPFVFLDHMGPVTFPAGIPREVDVRPHPHIGLSTLSYLFAGEMTHRDSLGSLQAVRPGEVNWMTAGRGITHSERFERARAEGGTLDGLQAWVALPQEQEECEPDFSHVAADQVPQWREAGVFGRLVAGEAFGLSSCVPVRSPLFYVHWELAPGARVPLPEGYSERALYVAAGVVEIAGQRAGHGQLVVVPAGVPTVLQAIPESTVVALGGESLGPRFIDWNFVSSRRERIEAARSDWQQGRFPLPPHDDQEFIPLPPPPAPPNPMS